MNNETLIERLSAAIKLGEVTGARGKSPHNIYNIAAEAASELERLQARNGRLRGALRDIETCGEGYAKCREMARQALHVEGGG